DLPLGHCGDFVGARFAGGELWAHAPALGDDEGIPHRLVIHPTPEPGAGYAVGLIGHALAAPEALARVDVVHRAEHLAVQSLYVVGLGEAFADHLPVARDRRRGGVGAAVLLGPSPSDVVGHTL